MVLEDEAQQVFRRHRERDPEDHASVDDSPVLHSTLQSQGPTRSTGSEGHPEVCTPCTFYCFTRRGCNRGAKCRFCHLEHQSKLQQRRETWKTQQREKRKSIRERVRKEGAPKPEFNDFSFAERAPAGMPGPPFGYDPFSMASSSGGKGDGPPAKPSFSYSSSSCVFAVGQAVHIEPLLPMAPVQFHIKPPLPRGLTLSPTMGVISGAGVMASPLTSFTIEVEMRNMRTALATVEIEIVDFVRGDFAVGHISEVEPGKFMVLLHVPQDAELLAMPSV